MKFERGVLCEKGAVAKKAVFSLTNIVDGKRAISLHGEEACRGYLELVILGLTKAEGEVARRSA
jgi:hypothetical protein